MQFATSKIAIKSNPFEQELNEHNGWYSSASFGIQTHQGFIGMTWPPAPNDTKTLTPKLEFYVATGSFGSNQLADWTDVSTTSASITVPDSFSFNEATVTYTSEGTWKVTPGKPSHLNLNAVPSGILENLIVSQQMLSTVQAELVGLVKGKGGGANLLLSGDTLSGDEPQSDVVEKVEWDSVFENVEFGQTNLSGTITVKTALIAAFGYFILSGVTFKITKGKSGDTQVKFSYSGTKSADSIKQLFQTGANIIFKTGNPNL